MLAKLRASVGDLRLGERLAARRSASMQGWQREQLRAEACGTAGRWRPKATRTPFYACRPPKWALGARPAVKMDRERHMVPHARVRSMCMYMCMRAEEVPITPPLRRWGVGASFEFPQGGSLG